MLWREDDEGCLLCIGEHPTSDMRLPGAGVATCDVWRQSGTWRIRRPDATVATVVDGRATQVGRWTLVTLLGAEDAEGPSRSDHRPLWPGSNDLSARPGFDVDGHRIAEIVDAVPMLIGGQPCCAIRLPWTREGVAAAVRREGRTTWCYPFAGTTLTCNGVPCDERFVLNDGDVLALADAPPFRYADADEQLDRLLGVLRGAEPRPQSVSPPRPPTTTDRIASVVGDRRDSLFSIWEAALAIGTATALVGQCAVTIVRW